MTTNPEQLHELLTYCVDFAKLMLNDSGEFYPFGAVIGVEGKLKAVGASDGNERPSPQDLYNLLGATFKAQATSGEIIAAAMATNVNIPPAYETPYPDGIRVLLESRDYSRFVYFPYRLSKSGIFKKKISLTVSEPFSVAIPASFFSHSPTPSGA